MAATSPRVTSSVEWRPSSAASRAGSMSNSDGGLPQWTPRRVIKRSGLWHRVAVPFTQFLDSVWSERGSKSMSFMLLVSFAGFMMISYVGHISHSLAITAYAYMMFFDTLCLLSSLASIWVAKQKPTLQYTYGFNRIEVLSVFTSTIVLAFGCMYVLKEGIEHALLPHPIESTWMMPAALVGLLLHIVGILSVQRYAQSYVASESTSKQIKGMFESIAFSLCGSGYVFQSILSCSPLNVHVLASILACLGVFGSATLSQLHGWENTDAVVAILIALLITLTIAPISIHHGKILLQTVPANKVSELEKVIREIGTMDGVLEVKDDHFWMYSYNCLVGSMQVRISRDANEQAVSARIYSLIHPHIQQMTIQVVRDDS